MSEFIEKLKSRRSVRSFKSDMPPKEVIDEIISAGLYATSGMNRQPVIIVAVTNKEMRDRLSRMNAEIMGKDVDPFYNAPVVLIVLADKAAPTYLYDGTLVMENLMLAAPMMRDSEAVGFTVRRKNLKAKRAKKFSSHSVLRVTMRVSVTALSVM